MLIAETAEDDPFAPCVGLAELLVVADALLGREMALLILQASSRLEREPLQKASKELRRGGMRELADLVRDLAKQAPKAPWWRDHRKKWRTRSAQIVIDRRRKHRLD
jgi:hypothetical protein